jgi:hypothetical protein
LKNAKRNLVLAVTLVIGHLVFLLIGNQAGLINEPLPVHWGTDLQPDRFVSFEQHLIELGFIQLFALVFVSIAAFTKKRLLSGLLGITGIGVFALLQLIIWTTTVIQLSDSQQGFPFNLFLILLAIPLLLVVLVLQAPSIEIGERLQVKVSGVALLSLEYSEILDSEIVQLRARDYGGLGIRYSRGKLAFIPKPGRGLELRLRSGESVVVYSTQPEVLQSVVRNKLEQR